ncbi:hypothetical protein SAU060112_40052 [Staphylococcus aureus]|nr:hypothetical protein SAU060112_40052 [Staphylococcus aureus]
MFVYRWSSQIAAAICVQLKKRLQHSLDYSKECFLYFYRVI